MHRPMDGTTALMMEHALSLDQVESLTVIGSRPEFEYLRCHNPKDLAESHLSIEFGTAAALAFGQVTLAHVCQETLSNPDYLKASANGQCPSELGNTYITVRDPQKDNHECIRPYSSKRKWRSLAPCTMAIILPLRCAVAT